MSLRLRATLAVVLVLTNACATPIVDVVVNADAASVRVLEGERVLAAGRPPVTLHLSANVDHDIVVTAEGREARPVRLASVTNGPRVALTVVQCVLCPVVILMLPLVISRGVCLTLDPTEIDVTLGPGSGVAPALIAARPTSTSPAARPTPPPAPRPTPPPTPPPAPPSSPPPAPPPSSATPAPRPAPTPPAPARSAFCGKCGARLTTGATFCGGCGARLP